MPHNTPWSAKCRVFFHIGISCISSLLTAVSFVSSDSCKIASSLLAVTYFASAVFLARFRLYRAPFETPVAVAVFLLLGVQVTFKRRKQSAPTWISLVQTLLTIFRAVLRMISIALESDMEKFSFVADETNVAAIGFDYYDRSEDADLVPPIEDHDDDPFDQEEVKEWQVNEDDEEMLLDEEEDPLRVLNPLDDHVVAGVHAHGAFTSSITSDARRRHVVSKSDSINSAAMRTPLPNNRSVNIAVVRKESEDEDEPPSPPSSESL
ncbi:DGF-1-like protein, putative [Bodo saltans]|uniref:DGF-1-like protein, putative n=1 Tax=Bodo saltans TaxID=75058 RepID=A0A0S4IQ98_BODSA|nr:DGF-1-like protein, putative [Bodo saltans]|eukprot:CUF94350.1 DGF-1-like protein, putative [Bodo saltans]